MGTEFRVHSKFLHLVQRMAFFLRSTEDSEKMVASQGRWDSSPLILMEWTLSLDVRSQRVEITPVWMKLPGLPLDFCSTEVFREIRNSPRQFIEADMSFVEYGKFSVAHILVGLDLR
jgi:hypothetical protein